MTPQGLRLATANQEPASAEKIAAVHGAVDAGEVGIAFQPICDLRTEAVFGYEALARPKSTAFAGPQDLFRSAALLGRVGELGRVFREMALRHCPTWPLFLNIFPNEFDEGFLVRADDPIFRHRATVYLEIVESVPLSHFEQCHSVLAEIRARGAMLAIDDLGAGYSNLSYISELAPAIVKLDRELVSGVRDGSRQFRLLRSITALCQEMNARVVVEGVETAQELAVARAVGADFCQGYYLARPGFPLPSVDPSRFDV
jgi:EAL domain-containing protein (putative c-di-GMP-specific phosphodiesterase class I)